jgi:hypothetical protein
MGKFRSFVILCMLCGLVLLSNGVGLFRQFSGGPAVATAAAYTSFPVGAGGADVIPHQIVRTASDRLYIFAYQGAFSSNIHAYWTNTTGLPDPNTTFSSTSLVETANPLSVEVAYDGGHIIHVLDNTVDGKLNDHIFDTSTNTFKATISIATGNPAVAGDYVGTSGLSAMIGSDQSLNIAFWSAGGNITYRAYVYNDQALTLNPVNGSAQQVNTIGSANHPALAISPVDGSITVAWISEADNVPKILARSKSGGSWGAVETVSAATPWTSTQGGINIDQGPSLIIDNKGTKHLAYIENYDNTGDYGRIRYASNSGAGWSDTALAAYTHDPAVAVNSLGEVYIIGHGHAHNAGCTSNLDMCVIKKNAGNTWDNPAIFAQHSPNNSFDTSPSVKWSVVGYNRPETIEFIFPLALNANYSNTVLYYGSIVSSVPPPPTLEVTSTTDSGNINLAGTLSYALDKAATGQTIIFNLTAGTTINITGKIPPVKPGVHLRYLASKPGSGCTTPVTFDGRNVPGGANLVLGGGNIIEGLIILTSPPGPGIVSGGTNNSISCTKVSL